MRSNVLWKKIIYDLQDKKLHNMVYLQAIRVNFLTELGSATKIFVMKYFALKIV